MTLSKEYLLGEIVFSIFVTFDAVGVGGVTLPENVIVKLCVYAVPSALPLSIVAKSVTVPFLVALSTLSPEMFAPAPFDVIVHFTVLYDAVLGDTTGDNVNDCPVIPVVGIPDIPVTAVNVDVWSLFTIPLSFVTFLSVLIVLTVPLPLNTTSELESNVPI